jgi:hypothetical protein
VVAGAPAESERWPQDKVEAALKAGAGQPPSQLAKDVAGLSGWSRSEVYDLLQDLTKRG